VRTIYQNGGAIALPGAKVRLRLSPAELAEYQPLFDNAKKLRALLADLQDLTLRSSTKAAPSRRNTCPTGAARCISDGRQDNITISKPSQHGHGGTDFSRLSSLLMSQAAGVASSRC
jgi:hypothetical protein